MVTTPPTRCAPLVLAMCSTGAGNWETARFCIYVKVFGLGTVATVNTPVKPGSVRNVPDWIGFGVVGAGTELTETVSPGNSRFGTVVVIVTFPVTVLPETVFVRCAPEGLTIGEFPPAVNVGGNVSETMAVETDGPLLVMLS